MAGEGIFGLLVIRGIFVGVADGISRKVSAFSTEGEDDGLRACGDATMAGRPVLLERLLAAPLIVDSVRFD